MEKLLQFGYYALAGVVLLLGVFLVLLQTALIPGYEVRIVQSGSMEPALKTGSVIVIYAAERYLVNDVVTFTTSANASTPTTHRIIADEITDGELRFSTKGDANEAADVGTIAPDQILGKTVFHIPFLGFLLDFARQPLGFALLIVLPAALIVIEEVGNMYRAVRPKEAAVAESSTTDKATDV